MEKISFSDVVGIGGIALATVFLVLDKAGKLKGGWLLGLLCLAGAMTLFIALGNAWVLDSPRKWMFWRGALMVCFVAFTYSGLAIWISGSSGDSKKDKPEAEKPDLPQLQITYGMLQTLPIVVSPGARLHIVSFHDIHASQISSVTYATNAETKTWYWPKKAVEPDFIGLCQLGNQGDKIVFNISITFGLHFRQHGKNMPDIAYTKQEVFIEGSLKPGDYARIYLANESTFDVIVDLPGEGELEVQGESGRQKAKITRLTTSIVDQIPPILAPSRNKWPQ